MDFLEFNRAEFERRDKRLQTAVPLVLKKSEEKKEELHIVYVMTWTGICGGSKIIFQHCNKFAEMGHKATIVCRYPRPVWFPLRNDVTFIQASPDSVLCAHIPKCDVIVATYWKEIYECVEQNIAPVVYFEQGDTHLFEPEIMDSRTLAHIRKQIAVAPFIYTVSSFAKEKLQENFGVSNVEVIPNAVDKSVFYPRTRDNDGKILICAIGSENIHFKCIQNIVTAVTLVKKLGHDTDFIWITPDTPKRFAKIPAVVNPPQKEIGDILRRSHIFLCASLYESFCLPVLEAMTCGAAVITTDCGGVKEFVKDKTNALIIKKNDIADMLEKLEMLVKNTGLRQKLSNEALKTSTEFDWSITMDRLVNYYRNISSYHIIHNP